ncbi:MAG: murein biosynthesis integral membrane protein MurJ [Defluviitaleaceae bacterium]|nr:murein biosynthesis integral membrane protein MurJ [Defluviitaleaceae bacterium]
MEKSQTNRQTKAVVSVIIILLIGKMAGLFREIMFGFRYGTGTVYAEAFGYAAQFPSVLLDTLVTASLTAAFIPVFSSVYTQKGKDTAFRLARSFTTIVLFVTCILTIALTFAAPVIIRIFASFQPVGYFADEVTALATPLLRIMMPTVVLTGLAFVVTGILQALEEFNAPAAMSLVSNLLIIVYLAFFVPIFGVVGLAVAYVLGWGTQVLVQLPALRKKGFRYRPVLFWRDADVRQGLRDIWKLMIPIMIGAWIFPINTLINTAVAGSVTGVAAFRYSYTIFIVLTGIFVLAITNVMFTKFSKLAADNKDDELSASVTATTRLIIFFTFPLAALIFVFAPDIIRIVYERGEFTEASTYITGGALRYFALGMPAFGIFQILSRACYTKRDGRTPLVAGLIAVCINVGLSIMLVMYMGVSGTALSFSVSLTLAALVLLASLIRKRIFKAGKAFYINTAKIVVLTVFMGFAVFYINQLIVVSFAMEEQTRAGLGIVVLGAAVSGVAGLVVYLAGSVLLTIEEARYVSWKKKKS